MDEKSHCRYRYGMAPDLDKSLGEGGKGNQKTVTMFAGVAGLGWVVPWAFLIVCKEHPLQ